MTFHVKQFQMDAKLADHLSKTPYALALFVYVELHHDGMWWMTNIEHTRKILGWSRMKYANAVQDLVHAGIYEDWKPYRKYGHGS